MATINTGLGGPQGVGEGSYRAGPLTAGNWDDGSVKVNITSVFGPAGINYFGTNYTSIYINSNGLITFAGPLTSYTPTNIAAFNQPAIAVFWSDVNVTTGSATGTNNIYWDLDPATGRVTVTWLDVKSYSGNGAPRNTFQVVLQHTHDGNFEVDFIYQKIQWTNGGFGVAQTGLTDGGANDFILPGSGNSTALAAYSNAILDPNDPNGVWSTRFLNGNPVCFVAGTRIATPGGARAVETLRPGDLVITLDEGPQPLRWVGGGSVVASGGALPVRIAAGVLGNRRAFCVSGQHLVVLDGMACELLFGETEVLVAAQDLLGFPGVTRGKGPCHISYHHLLLDRHQVIFAEGARVESLHPGPMAMAALPHRARAALRAVFLPYELERLAHQPAARRVLKPHEVQVLLAAHQPMVPTKPVRHSLRIAA
ncbi:MAG: Hint domain-containing protein [Paracoccaceae bacterium]|nr:Hint domain-containing protein [Paracoccaceae bacterium]